MKNQNIPTIYVINLKKDIIKKQHIKEQLNRLGLEAEYIEAINGKLLKEIPDIKTSSDLKSTPKLGRGEIGCLLSHRKIYQIIIERGDPWSIILEDDVDLKNEFIEVVKSLSKLQQDDKLIFLGHHSCNARSLRTMYSFRSSTNVYKNYKLTKPLENVCGTYGYLISLEGAKLLLDKTFSIQKPIDHYTGECNGLSSLIIVPEIVTINTKFDHMSSIDRDRNKRKGKLTIVKDRLLEIWFINGFYRLKHYILSIVKGIFLDSCIKRGD